MYCLSAEIHTDADGEHDREELGDEHELQGVAHHALDVRHDLALVDDRGAELVGDGVLEPVAVRTKIGSFRCLRLDVLDPAGSTPGATARKASGSPEMVTNVKIRKLATSRTTML